MSKENALEFEFRKSGTLVFPTHPFVKNWAFKEDEEREAMLAQCMAEVAEKNGMSSNDLSHIFPATLRMLKSDSSCAK